MEVKFENNGKVKRRFNKDWQEQGVIRTSMVPLIVQSVVDQRKSMIEYIDKLHDKIDELTLNQNK